jgi:hypothetical protein
MSHPSWQNEPPEPSWPHQPQQGGQQPPPPGWQQPPQPGWQQPPPAQPGWQQPPAQPGWQQSPPQPGWQQPPAPAGGQQPWQPEPPQQQAWQQSYPPAVPPPPKKSRAGRIILIVALVLVVLCGGGGVAAYFLLGDTVGEAVQAAQTRVEAPTTLVGRPKITDAQFVAIVDEMVAQLRKDIPEATSTAAGFYGDPAKQDMVMIAAASGRVPDPDKQLDDAFTGIGTSGLTVSGIETVEPGPLGGTAKCGTANAQGVPIVMCIWADAGSLGVVGYYFKSSVDEVATDFVKARGEVEKRS